MNYQIQTVHNSEMIAFATSEQYCQKSLACVDKWKNSV